jgi:hypothetical protein
MVREYTYKHTDCWKGLMRYAVEKDSSAIICIYTKFLKDWFRPLKVDRGNAKTRRHIDDTATQTAR